MAQAAAIEEGILASSLVSSASSSPAHQAQCRHCGTSFAMTSALDPSSSADQFCCQGCRHVYHIIHQSGLTDYYKMNPILAPVSPDAIEPEGAISSRWSQLDLPSQIERLSEDGVHLRFFIQDLATRGCTACVWILEHLQQVTDDVQWARLDMSRGELLVARAPSGRFSRIAQAIHDLGYQATPMDPELRQGKSGPWLESQRRELIRLGVIAGLTGNIMLMAVSLYAGAEGHWELGFRWIMAFLALPVVTWGAWPLYENAWRALRWGRGGQRISLDLPVAIAVIAGAFAGWLGLLMGRDTLFFDSVAMLVLLIQASRFSLTSLRRRWLGDDERLAPWLMSRVQSLQGEELSPWDLQVGTKFRLLPGQMLPVDAAVKSQTPRAWDLSVITGESEAIWRSQDAELPAGARLIDSAGGEAHEAYVELEAKARIHDTRIMKLVRGWQNAPVASHSLSQMANRVGQIFIVATFLAAAVLAFGDFFGLSFTAAAPGWQRALTLLIVSCPCVFGFAIPLAENMAIRRAAELGVLIRDPSFFERLRHTEHIMLDKTGTLTSGEWRVRKWKTHPAAESFDVVAAIVMQLERNENHPVARALYRHALHARVSALEAKWALRNIHSELNGSRVGEFGQYEFVLGPAGSPAEGLETLEPTSISSVDATESSPPIGRFELRRRQRQPDGEIAEEIWASFELEDDWREGAVELLADWSSEKSRWLWPRLKSWTLLSGDRDEIVQATKARLELLLGQETQALSPSTRHTISLKAESQLQPSAKADRIRDHQSVFFMGDGANDAEALRLAHTSIALRGELSLCLESAQAVSTTSSLEGVRELPRLAKRLQLALRRALIFSAGINLLSATLAFLGWMTPLWAAILMPISGTLVTLVAWWTLSPQKRSHTSPSANSNLRRRVYGDR
ncbi:MAG TPA: heavy metal translocating P-type ATPase metal-binding domain-containing protein [Pseudobdellovibrionaceae bacterium]|nr:heavy metal translocating P-type ATPase metal-binding domain-containing protein [Pseudobdellovibrionaceae bacterium]